MEVQIVFPTSTLGLLVNQLSMVMTIRFSGIPENWRDQYTVQENKQRGDKEYGWGGQSQGTHKRDTQDR